MSSSDSDSSQSLVKDGAIELQPLPLSTQPQHSDNLPLESANSPDPSQFRIDNGAKSLSQTIQSQPSDSLPPEELPHFESPPGQEMTEALRKGQESNKPRLGECIYQEKSSIFFFYLSLRCVKMYNEIYWFL